MPPPPAATITIRDTLAMLDGPKRTIAEGVANDQYVFWLGSGISRARMPDLSDLAKNVLRTLQRRIDQADPTCRYRRALSSVINLAAPSPDEWARIDDRQAADLWPDLDTLARRLVGNYARMLNVSVDGEEADFLLWDVLDAANVYSDPGIEPDAEHLSLAALAIEGVASEMPSANWDPLLERAVALLAGNRPILRVAVAPEETRRHRGRANLYKFHGCAEAARSDPGRYRRLLVARQNQIHGWAANNTVMASALTQLILTKPTLMLGLSAQDSNIQGLFAEAQVRMPWRWPTDPPSNPPAYAFAENALGGDQENLLQNVYNLDHSPANRPPMAAEALVQAYAKPLLLALWLYVVTAKLRLLVDHGPPGLAPADREKLREGLVHARDVVAEALVPTSDVVTELLGSFGRLMAMFRDGHLPAAGDGIYSPICVHPLHAMPADPALTGSGIVQFALAAGLIGLGLQRGHWSANKADLANPASGAFVLTGRSGPAKVYFAASPQAAIRLGVNGLVADNDDAVIVHSQMNPPPMHRSPRRPPGRTGLATVREVSVPDLLDGGAEVEDLLNRFRGAVAL
ncbi:SIR2 family protein [Methylorubrum thiocyanatum]|uniref:SIR2 family protein n=1 Tax=Methylorubrum thiocyanatum TaxID=47958 RepID=UPI0035C7CC3E